MKPTPIEFSEWRPDIATLDTKFASEVENVFAGVNSYLPFPSLLAFSGASLSDAGNDSFTKVLLQFDGPTTTVTDSNIGGSAHTWTAAGNATCSTGDFQFGAASLLCDGTGDWVTTPDHADFTLGSGDWSVDFWFKVNVAAGADLYAFGQTDATASVAATSIRGGRDSTGKMFGQVAHGNGIDMIAITGTRQFTDVLEPGWHHYALVRTANTLKLFIDGIQEGGNRSISSVNNSSNAFRVGALGEYTSTPWNGRIDAFRLSVGVARWTDTFTPPRVAYFNAGGRVCGLYSARTSSGAWKVYAGTTTKLLTWSLAGWVDVSRIVNPTGALPYNVPPTEMWVFEQSGHQLVAVNINDDPQVIDIDAGTSFARLAAAAPRAGHVRQIGDFLFLSRLDTSGGFNNRCVIWSAINDITGFTIGLNLCDMQEFPDGGPVQGVMGAEIGYVIQDRTIRTMQFLPGDTTFIFNFTRALHDRGSVSKYGFNSIGNVLYFVAEDGFYSASGQQITPIGADKVNEWFLGNSDVTRRDVVHCLAGVNKPRVVWVFHASSASPIYDKQIIFDWSNARWAKASVPAQIWGLLASPGLDLDTTGSEINDALLDTPPFPEAQSLDSFAYMGGRPLIGAIDPDGFLATLQGPNLPATLETAEVHLVPGRRAFVDEVYPIDDAAAAGSISNGTRETLQSGAPFWSPPIDIEPLVGSAFVMTSARLHRFRRMIPNAAVWTHAQGVAVNMQPDGDGITL